MANWNKCVICAWDYRVLDQHTTDVCLRHYEAKSRRLGGKPPNLTQVASILQRVMSVKEANMIVNLNPPWIDQINRLSCTTVMKVRLFEEAATSKAQLATVQTMIQLAASPVKQDRDAYDVLIMFAEEDMES